jgi:hypothetical protein
LIAMRSVTTPFAGGVAGSVKINIIQRRQGERRMPACAFSNIFFLTSATF